jgi:acyl transferase domain-containing protein
MFGHSVGEIAAAYVAKALTAAEVVAYIAKCSQNHDLLASEVKIAAVISTSEDAALACAWSHGLKDIRIAAINTPN